MTELEALKLALKHYVNGSPEDLVDEARDIVRTLVKRLEDAEADPEIACGMAENMMNCNGQYVTATFSQDWLDEVLAEYATRKLTQGEMQSLLHSMVSHSIDDALEQTLDCIKEWLGGNAILNELNRTEQPKLTAPVALVST